MSSPSLSPTVTASSLPTAWKAWSIPVDVSSMRHHVCGLLNKLTRASFDVISEQIVRWAVSIDRAGDPETLDIFVRSIFSRGIADHRLCRLYANLCQKVTDELEAERSSWRKVDLYHLGNPVHSFETALRLLAHEEFYRLRAVEDPSTLSQLMTFLGELLVQGVLYVDDVRDVLDTLFDHSEHNHEEHTLALCRFLNRVVGAFNAYQILGSLQIGNRIEHVLQEDSLSLRARYLLMSMLDQVLYPQPHDAFSSTRERIEVYGIDLESDTESMSGADEPVRTSQLSHACRECVRAFLYNRDCSYIETHMRGLKPSQRPILIRELISSALHGNDFTDAFSIGSLFAIRSIRCLFTGFPDAFEAELNLLADTTLDVPHASSLMAVVLNGTGLDKQVLETIISRSLAQDDALREHLLGEVKLLQEHSDSGTDFQPDDESPEDETHRKNRFERDTYSEPTSGHAYAY